MAKQSSEQAAIEQARERFNKAKKKLMEIEEEQRDRLVRPALRKSVGKCFVYQNSYGSGEKWPLYAKVVSFDEKDMTYETVEFQQTSRNHIEIEHHRRYNFQGVSWYFQNGWTEISASIYNREKRKCLRTIHALLEPVE